jgi:hypothetical protein
MPRETRERFPLVTVQTEVNGDSKSTNERGPSLVGSLGLSCRYKRFFMPWLLQLVQYKIIFFSPYNITIPLSPAGQAAVLGRLSLSMCIWACQRMIQNRSSELYNFLQPWEWYSMKTNSAAQAKVSLLTGQELHSCELLTIPAAAVLVYILLNVYNRPTVIT